MKATIELNKDIEGNFIDIISPEQEKMTTQIYNRLGITLKHIESASQIHRIDISELPEGIYFIKVKIGDHSRIMRFTRN